MEPCAILLTGATGVVGREVAAHLLRQDPGGRVIALIRAGDGDAVARRWASILRYLRLYHADVDARRIEVLSGDVTEPHLGLSGPALQGLERRVTHILHTAASTRLDLPFACARAINITGTDRMLHFAQRCRRLERFGYTSTAFVAGDRSGRITESELARGQGFLNGYEQSKYEAELLVRERSDRLPVTVFRPSIIVGDATDGHIGSLATILHPIRSIALRRVRRIPGHPDFPLDLVGLDFVAAALARLLFAPEAQGETYHLTAGPGNAIALGELLDHATRIVGTRDAVALDYCGPGNREHACSRLSPFFAYLQHEKGFDDGRLRLHVPELAATRRHPRAWLDRLLHFCTQTRWGAAFPWEEEERCLTTATL